MEIVLDYKDLLNRAKERLDSINKAIEQNNTRLLKDLCVCSLLSGNETIVKDKTLWPVIGDDLSFMYKDYKFILSDCTGTDRYNCWVELKTDQDKLTLDMYLARHPEETRERNCWTSELVMVPDAWCSGSEYALIPGETVNGYILKSIDKYLELNDPSELNHMLDTFVLMVLAQYSYTSLDLDEDGWDQSLQSKALLAKLKAANVTLLDIEQRIKDRDFTDRLTDVGFGNRERGFVMDYVEEQYFDIQ